MSSPLVQALIAHVDSVFEGPNGDYPAVLEALAGVSATQGLWKPLPQQNSIWQIVEHLIASKLWQIDMLTKGQAASPVWTDPSGDEAEWQATLGRLQDAHRQLGRRLVTTSRAVIVCLTILRDLVVQVLFLPLALDEGILDGLAVARRVNLGAVEADHLFLHPPQEM